MVKITISKPFENGIANIEIEEETADLVNLQFDILMKHIFPQGDSLNTTPTLDFVIKPKGIKDDTKFGQI